MVSLLAETPEPEIKATPYEEKPYWHLERARIDGAREVPVELIVNGESVARKTIVADGKTQEVSFDVPIEKSSWVALRIEASYAGDSVVVSVSDDGRGIDAGEILERAVQMGGITAAESAPMTSMA